jgi:hypothetical protein
MINAGEDMERKAPSHTTGRNIIGATTKEISIVFP